MGTISEALIKKIQSLSNEEILRGRDENNIPYLKHVFDLHLKIFGQTCSNCPNKINGYIQKIKKFKIKEIMEISKSEFKLKEGVIIPVPGTSEVYSKSNLTDDKALELLSQNINRKALFDVVPEDLEDRIKNYFAEIEVDLTVELPNIEEIGVEQTLKLLSLVGITTKATTIEGLNKKIQSLDPETVANFTLEVDKYLETFKL